MNNEIINKYKLIGWDFYDRYSSEGDSLLDIFGEVDETNEIYATSPNISTRFYVCQKDELSEDILIESENKWKKISDIVKKYVERGRVNLPVEFPVKIKSIQYSGGTAPYQMDATTEDGRYFYLRYRHERLMAGVSDTEATFDWSQCYFINVKFDHGDSRTDDEAFKKELEGKVILPEGFKFE